MKNQEKLNIKFKTVYTYVGGEVAGYMMEKTIEFGNWIICREGKEDNEGNFIHWAGDWTVSRKEEIYGSFNTLKAAKNYIKIWLQYNPQDK